VWRSGNRPNTRKMLRHHGEKFLGNFTYINLYDLMSQVPSFPSDVWRLVETKTMEPLAFVDRAEVTDPRRHGLRLRRRRGEWPRTGTPGVL
jgi:hypothetical protein